MNARAITALALPLVVAAATVALVVMRAVMTVDPYWDTLAYHWVFAARLGGLCDRACFAMPAGMEALYDGFPLAAHALQGWLWRVTGTPALGDFVNIVAVAALCGYLRWRFRVPLTWSWLALLAIPVVQIELTSSYIDLAVNAAATIALLVAIRILIEREGDFRADVALALAAIAFAAGSKFLMLPIAALAWGVIVIASALRPQIVGMRGRGSAFVVLAVAGVAVLAPKLALNAERFGNPVYPVAVNVGPWHLPGTTTAEQPIAVSAYWADSPQPVRWIASVAEYDAFRGRPLPWVISQGDVPQTSPSFRMGGYFVAYVIATLALLVAACAVPRVRVLGYAMVVLTLLCAVLPNSHELRYYMFWMMALAAFCLIAAHSPHFTDDEQPRRRTATHAVILTALASVVAMTGGDYLDPKGQTLDQVLGGPRAVVATFPEGGTVCVRDRNRFAILYASVFHPGRHYGVRLLADDEAEPACTVRVTLP